MSLENTVVVSDILTSLDKLIARLERLNALVSKSRERAALQDSFAAFTAFAPAVTAAAEKRFAADAFSSTFEVTPGEDAITIKLYPRPGSVQYIVSATGPQSLGVKFEAGIPKFVALAPVVEISP